VARYASGIVWLTYVSQVAIWQSPMLFVTPRRRLRPSGGANVKVVQRMLGHASAAMTLDVYAELFVDDLTAVADKLSETVGKMWARAGDAAIQQT
jgi:hypothetical protein